MASNDATVLTEHAFRELRRAYWEQKRELKNLRHSLSILSTRLEHTVKVPPPRIKFKNTASETAPAWAVMRITTPTAQAEYLSIAKPDATYRWLYLVNGPKDVPQNGYGYGHFLTAETFTPRRGRVLYDTGATPAVGERWGPKNDSWLIWQHRLGFWIVGSAKGSQSTARVAAVQLPPGEVRVKNDDGSGTLAAGGTGRTFGIYGGTAGTTDTGLEVTLNNGSTTAWAADKYGWATADAGGAIWGAPHQT
jgi:hypothetical protein